MSIRRICKLSIPVMFIAVISLGMSISTRAEIIINNVIPFGMTVNNACTGEPVVFSGTLHVLVHETIDASGGYHYYSHFQPMNVGGEGQVTGTRYRATGGTLSMVNDSGSPQYEESFINNFNIVGQGRGGNWMVHANFHVSINANGDVVVDSDNAWAECR